MFGLDVNVDGPGQVVSDIDGIACGADCDEDYFDGMQVVLTAAAAAGATFDGWTSACAGAGDTCVVDMDAAKSVTASFSSAGSAGGVCAAYSAPISVTGRFCLYGSCYNMATTARVLLTRLSAGWALEVNDNSLNVQSVTQGGGLVRIRAGAGNGSTPTCSMVSGTDGSVTIVLNETSGAITYQGSCSEYADNATANVSGAAAQSTCL